MRIRFFLVILSLLFASCDKLSFSSSKKQSLDTNIDFSKVDMSPAFVKCKFLEPKERAICFETELQQRIQKQLKKQSFSVKEDFNENIELLINIDNKGKINLKAVKSSAIVQKHIPKLDSILEATIKSLPQILPATKQNIPVEVEYRMPLTITSTL